MDAPPIDLTAIRPAPEIRGPAGETDIEKVARDLETAFLTEMLRHAGVAEPREGLGGGGAGEEAFASFMVREYAAELSARGGIGLAQSIVTALAREQSG